MYNCDNRINYILKLDLKIIWILKINITVLESEFHLDKIID